MFAGVSGFWDAWCIKGLGTVVVVLSLLASIFNFRPFLTMHLPSIIFDLELWRLCSHHLVVSSTGEVLLFTLAFYALRELERRAGAKRFAGQLAALAVCVTALNIAALVLFSPLGMRTLLPGPYGLLFGLAPSYAASVPALWPFSVSGWSLSEKSATYLYLALLLFHAAPHSCLVAACGLLAALVVSSDLAGLASWAASPYCAAISAKWLLPLVRALPRLPDRIARAPSPQQPGAAAMLEPV